MQWLSTVELMLFQVTLITNRYSCLFSALSVAKVNYAVMQYLVNKKSTFQHFMTGPEWNSEFCFPRISVFPKIMLLETLGFEGNKIQYSTRDKSLTDL